jgi:hypothetical protein
MIYILLFLHFGFNVFFIMCFSAFIFGNTQSKFTERMSALYLFIYSIIEFAGVSFLLIDGCEFTVWRIWIGAVAISCLISLTLYFFRKLDITMWGPFSVIFAPLILVPILIFLLVTNNIKGNAAFKN